MFYSSKVAFCFTAGVLLALPAASRADDLPDGPGKVPLQRICAACHTPEIVIGRHESKDRWDAIVSSMVEKGAVGTDEEFNLIVDYLAANFGKPSAAPNNAKQPEEPKKQ
jgi:mono/diheme cytochrome c family protein